MLMILIVMLTNIVSTMLWVGLLYLNLFMLCLSSYFWFLYQSDGVLFHVCDLLKYGFTYLLLVPYAISVFLMHMNMGSSFYFDISRDQMSWELSIFIFLFASFMGLVFYGILVCLAWLTLLRFCCVKFLVFGIYIMYYMFFLIMFDRIYIYVLNYFLNG